MRFNRRFLTYSFLLAIFVASQLLHMGHSHEAADLDSHGKVADCVICHTPPVDVAPAISYQVFFCDNLDPVTAPFKKAAVYLFKRRSYCPPRAPPVA